MASSSDPVAEVAGDFARDQFNLDPPALRQYLHRLTAIPAECRRASLELFYETQYELLNTLWAEYPPAPPDEKESRSILDCFRSDWHATQGRFSRNWILIACGYLRNRSEVVAWLRERSSEEPDDADRTRLGIRADEIERMA